MTRRAFTMVELLMTVALSAVVIGTMTGIFGFTSSRLSDAYTKSMLVDQTTELADKVEATVRDACVCVDQDSGAALQCLMPQNGVDTDGDGHYDSYYPDDNAADGSGAYSSGNYVWFYQAGATSAYGAGSGFVWRAEKADSAKPGLADLDRAFAFYYNGKLKYTLVNKISFSVDAATRTVTYTVTGTTRLSTDSTSNTTEDATSRKLTLTRTVQWRNGG